MRQMDIGWQGGKRLQRCLHLYLILQLLLSLQLHGQKTGQVGGQLGSMVLHTSYVPHQTIVDQRLDIDGPQKVQMIETFHWHQILVNHIGQLSGQSIDACGGDKQIVDRVIQCHRHLHPRQIVVGRRHAIVLQLVAQIATIEFAEMARLHQLTEVLQLLDRRARRRVAQHDGQHGLHKRGERKARGVNYTVQEMLKTT